MLRCLLPILSIAVFNTCLSQPLEEENFRRYSVEAGLSNNYVTGILQDSYGYIWVSTYKGLNRFDGSKFDQYHSDSSANSLPGEIVYRLKWLDKERLAAITLFGLHIVNTRTLESHNLIIPDPASKKLPLLNRVSDAFTSKNGEIFISTYTGFYHFDKNEKLVFRYDHPLHKPSSHGTFGWIIAQPEENVLLLSTFNNNGLYIYNIARRDLHPVGLNDAELYGKMAIKGSAVMQVEQKNNTACFIIPSDSAFFLYDVQKKKEYRIPVPFQLPDHFDASVGAALLQINDSVFVFNDKESGCYFICYDQQGDRYWFSPERHFQHYVCTAFLSDKNQQLWVATDDGLHYQQKPSAKIDQITLKQLGIRNNILTMEVSNNKIFAGTNREGLMVYDRSSLEFIKRLDFSGYHESGFPNMILCSNLIDPDSMYLGLGGIWLNTKNYNNGAIKLKQLDSTFEGLELIFTDSHKNTYLKKATKNIFYIRGSDNKFRTVDYRHEFSRIGNVTNISEDPGGNTWFAGRGLMRFNYQLQKFDLTIDSFPGVKNPGSFITTSIAFDRAGKIYFGIWESGLAIYDPVKKSFQYLTRNDGLPDNTIRSIFLHKTKLWLATESGLACYDLPTKHIFTFGAADGIPSNPFNSYLLYYDSTHNHLYGALRNIIYRFNPDSLIKNNSAPDFVIESVVVSGKTPMIHPDEKIELAYRDNNVVINMASVNFEDAYHQQFAYRFVEDNENWQDIGFQRSIIFSNLSAGKHRLQVKVFTADGSWPEQIKEVSIIIHPPFWKTPWFYSLCVAALAALVFSLHKRRVMRIEQKADLDRWLAQTEMKALHAQMNPHFIFNCLNSIREMILHNENQQASHYLSKFAQLIRITLNQSSKQFISLQDTIDYLERYLEMEKIRNEKFNYTIEVDEPLHTYDIMIPPMLIQPFLENSIWHGAVPDKFLQVTVRFLKKNDELVCVIEDNGIGVEASLKNKNDSQHNSIGIANVKERIQVLNEKYNLHSSLVIEDKSNLVPRNGTGTIVKLCFPFNSLQS